MAIYAVGDLQGCLTPLQKLLDKVAFGCNDQLWLVGDLINRGPQSADSLRFVKGLGEQAKVVLGNHDLHLLSVAAGCNKFLSKKDTLDDILQAKDKIELVEWLRHQPLLVTDSDLNVAMVHAGIPPQWRMKEAKVMARDVETVLQSDDDWQGFVSKHMLGNQPNHWHQQLNDKDRRRYGINAFTRMRFCDANGTLDFKMKGKYDKRQQQTQKPWFVHPRKLKSKWRIVFGHWSALQGNNHGYDHVWPLDTGCIWGGKMTLQRLDADSSHDQRYTHGCAKYGYL